MGFAIRKVMATKKKKHLATLPRIGGFQWQKSFFGVGHFVER
jgi:hypothetical protein